MTDDPVTAFIRAAIWHGSLDEAEAILAAQPEIAGSGIHAAAILGDDTGVRRFLSLDSRNATGTAGPHGADPLVHLCLSRYLRLDPSRSDGFVRAATALLDAGADPDSGFWTAGAHRERETALYGAAGVAHHAGLTRLLLERGADPNDEEAVYHSPETHDSAAMQLLVETGRLTADNLVMMLLRKHDWYDYDGVRTGREERPGRPACAFEHRGIPVELDGPDRLIAACARNDTAAIRAIAQQEPGLVREVVAEGGTLLAEFAGNGNTDGVQQLLDLGVEAGALYGGDGYFDIAENSTALHVAAWRARHQTVKLLIARGSPPGARDGKGRTPLALAVKACVDSYWSSRRSPESVEALLGAGATAEDIPLPTGHPEADQLLEAGRRAARPAP